MRDSCARFCTRLREIFEERTERATQRLATLAEPVMIVIFGLIVAFVALSLLQAIYGINAGSSADAPDTGCHTAPSTAPNRAE